MTGMDLKLQRVALRVSARQLAEAMGVTGARVSHIEAQAAPTAEATARYLAALEPFSRKQAA